MVGCDYRLKRPAQISSGVSLSSTSYDTVLENLACIPERPVCEFVCPS